MVNHLYFQNFVQAKLQLNPLMLPQVKFSPPNSVIFNPLKYNFIQFNPLISLHKKCN